MENKVEKSEPLLEMIIANLPGHVYWLNKDNVYMGCNDLQAMALGLSSRLDIKGKKNIDFAFLDPFIAEIWDKNNLSVMESKTAQIFEEPTIFEACITATVLSHKKPLLDENGMVIGLLGISLDVTERNKIEAMLKEKVYGLGVALENIIGNLPGHVYWQDVNNVFLGCNDAQAQSAGLKTRQDIVGKTNYDLPWCAQAKNLNDINNHVMKTGKEYSIEEAAFLSNGQHAVFLSKKVPLFDSNKNIVGIMGISFDITQRKKIEEDLKKAKEQLEIANHVKTEFLENMRHDIRTPLSGIVGFAELLVGETDQNKINLYTQGLAESSNELLRFLNEILESINVTSGNVPILRKRFDLKEVLSNVIKLHSSIALKKGLDLKLFFDEHIPKYLIGDPIRVYRIILELLSNSLKFTNRGHVHVLAKLYKKCNQKIITQIVVEDTGPGIQYDKQKELFVRFKRLTPSYEGIYEGAGLGLSIVKHFIDDLQGEVYIDSNPSIGTRFICVIQLQEALWDESGEEIHSSIIETKNCPRQNNRISALVVDDQFIAVSVVKSILENLGCEVHSANDAEGALELIKKKTYDIIFMDIGLPKINGYEATKLIRSMTNSNPSQYRPLIVGLTGHVDQNKSHLGLNVGMNMVLSKPLTHHMALDILNLVPNQSSKQIEYANV